MNLMLNEWEKDLREDVNNYLFDDELNLWARMKYNNKKVYDYWDEILCFFKRL